MARKPADEWRHIATEARLASVESGGAFVIPELEAKLAEAAWGGYPTINPHQLTTARLRLLRDGHRESALAPTRGGGLVPAYTGLSPTKAAERMGGGSGCCTAAI